MRVLIENLSKTYRSPQSSAVEALSRISFSIEEGEFVALVGPSGCGKTTLLQIIAGLLPGDEGKVVFENPVLAGRPHTAVVFQDLALFPWRSVERNIAYGLEELHVPRSRRKRVVDDLIAMVGLEGFGRKYPHQLSGGMRQRTAIARALAVNPMLLLMDEPFSSLDAQTRMLMQLDLARIHERTRQSVLYITHYTPEAVFLADRVVVLGPRPAGIQRIIPIALPRPRREKIKTAPEYVAYLDQIWDLMRGESAAAPVPADA